MSTRRSIGLSLAGAIALALYGVASVAAAQPAVQQSAQQQVPPPPPTAPAPPPPPATPAPPPPPATPAPTPPPAAPQPPPPPAAAQNAPQQTASGQFYQGTETSASYPLPDSNGGTLTVHSGMPADVQQYGPPPAFEALDTDHDGRISEAEAAAYAPLDNDFLDASNHATTISRTQYQTWVQSQGQQ